MKQLLLIYKDDCIIAKGDFEGVFPIIKDKEIFIDLQRKYIFDSLTIFDELDIQDRQIKNIVHDLIIQYINSCIKIQVSCDGKIIPLNTKGYKTGKITAGDISDSKSIEGIVLFQ